MTAVLERFKEEISGTLACFDRTVLPWSGIKKHAQKVAAAAGSETTGGEPPLDLGCGRICHRRGASQAKRFAALYREWIRTAIHTVKPGETWTAS
jgi:hypothetical protein